jgi:hypothetical protein
LRTGREFRVLEIADPVGHAKVAEIDDRRDVETFQFREGDVGEFPVVLAGAEKGGVDGRAVAQELDARFDDESEILAPALVMAAHLHLIDAGAAVVDRRDAVFDPVANMKLAMTASFR